MVDAKRFTFLNDLRSLRHSVRSTSLCSSDDRLLCSPYSRARCSTAEISHLAQRIENLSHWKIPASQGASSRYI